VAKAERYLRGRLHRTIMWCAFSVIVSLLPLYVNWLLIRVEAGGSALNWYSLFDHGELFLITSALAANSIGRLFSRKVNTGFLGDIIFVSCVFILVSSALEFGIFAKDLRLAKPIPWEVTHDSSVQFLAIVLAGLGTVWVED
jgi:hypothetical protein